MFVQMNIFTNATKANNLLESVGASTFQFEYNGASASYGKR